MARWNLVAMVLVLATAGLLVWAFDAPAQQPSVDPKLMDQYDRFIEIVGLVQKQYVRDVDTKKMFENAINGMLSGLDPFSNYINEEEMPEFTKMTRGKFGGVGIQIGMRKGFLTVISPLEETPAFRAGVLAGDIITGDRGQEHREHPPRRRHQTPDRRPRHEGPHQGPPPDGRPGGIHRSPGPSSRSRPSRA